MAYSPFHSPLQIPTRVPLIVDLENRDSTLNKDAKLVNCYVEMDQDKNYNLYRRPGMLQYQNPPGTTAAGMGVFYWNANVYSIFAGKLYKNGTQVVTGLDTTGGVYSFSSILGSDPKMVLQNGVQGYGYDDTALLSANLHSINASYPQYTCKGLAYLNGATYVLQHFFGTAITPAVIWGSVVNSVTNSGDWTPLDFITAQIEPDSGVYLAKQMVYVVCLKEWTTEIFFDAGNATGSPLQSMQNNKLPYGCATQDSVQRIDDSLLWISTSRSASNQVAMMEGLRIKIISTAEIERLLNQVDLSIVYSWQIKCNGHSFYVMTIKNANLTLAYDINQNRWSVWTDTNGNYVPIVASCRDSAGNHILQHESNGILYYGSPNYLDDNTQIFPIQIVTPQFTMNTMRKKQMGMVSFVGDQVPGSVMSVQVSDDGYQTWSQPRMVDLGMNLPNLPNCGTFRNRAWKLTVTNNLPWRLQAMETQLSVGVL